MFKVDDKVKVKKFEEPNIPKHIVSNMFRYFGKILTIESVLYNGWKDRCNEYTFKECPVWCWLETDVEEIYEFKKLKDNLFKV